MFLSDLPLGATGLILKVKGRGAFRRRIMEMGFVRGKLVKVVKSAPLQDPVQYSLMGYEVSLRRSEAALVEVLPPEEDSQVEGFIPGVQASAEGDFHRNGSKKDRITVALVGNPNCGKTTLFNVLSRSSEKVGNYAGVTVESKSALIEWHGYTFEFVDLPGTYSLSAYTPEERYVLNHIIHSMPDVVVNVVDGSNLERNLFLTTQLIDLDQRVILALNMYDELTDRGDDLDHKALGILLGMPVVPTVGTRGKGLEELYGRIVDVYLDKDPSLRHIHIRYGDELERSIKRIQDKIRTPENNPLTDLVSSRFLALRLLEGDAMAVPLLETASNAESVRVEVEREKDRILKIHSTEAESLITDAKYGFIEGALKETFRAKPRTRPEKSTRIDDFLTHKYLGFPLFFLFLYIMFQSTFSLGKYPVRWIEAGVGLLASETDKWLDPGPLKDLLIHGVIDGVGGVIVFLPNILILFLFIAFMEDTGYMARAAFMMDRLMHKIGLHGRSFIPLIMGFGCNVPAVMATRTIENRSNRILTMLINPFMSCSARLPVYVLLIGAFFPEHPGLVLFGLYATGIFLAILVALLLKRIFFRSGGLPFVMELPPYRMPTMHALSLHMWNRAGQYLRRMGGIIMVASVIIWALTYFPVPESRSRESYSLERSLFRQVSALDPIKNEQLKKQLQSQLDSIHQVRKSEEREQSLIAQLGHWIEPVLRPLGFDWRLGVSLLTGIAGKEIVVSTMGVIFQAAEGPEGSPLTQKLKEARWTQGPEMGQPLFKPMVAISFLLFILIYFPCIAVVAAVKNESGSWKWALFLVGYTTLLAWTASFIAMQLGTFIFKLNL